MSEIDKSRDDEMLGKLLKLFRLMLEQDQPELVTEPVADWAMDWNRLSNAGRNRLEIWDVLCHYAEHLFPIRVPWYLDTILEFRGPSELGRQIYVDRSFDPNEFYLLDQLLEKGMTFIDVGANVGVYSLFAARKVGASGQVIAFEPSRRESLALQRNLDINRISNVSLHALAVGQFGGSEVLHVADEVYNGHNSLNELSLSTTLPSIRFTTDRINHFWSGVGNGLIEIPVGRASNVEILLYSEQPFSYELDSVRIAPEETVVGGWELEITGERPLDLPSHLRTGFDSLSVSALKQPDLDLSGPSIKVAGKEGSGLAFRASLDGDHEYTILIEGRGIEDRAVAQYQVEVVSLDDFLGDLGRESIDVIKIDIEGGEYGALLGAHTVIEKHQPLILVEIVNKHLDADRLEKLHTLFADLQYVMFDMVKAKPRLIDVRGDHGSNVIGCPQRLVSRLLKLGDLDESHLSAPIEIAALEVEACGEEKEDCEGSVGAEVKVGPDGSGDAAATADEKPDKKHKRPNFKE